ncbi:MAG: hypothetical protein KDC85_12470 [Saprospiraceae bacterium]|nr:hypothetical protein [Saprospiraceae bacterium]MCB9322132.1 hypothetical protein [Lewinellaceae bacterium]
MKKILYIAGFALFTGMLISSCTKDEDVNHFASNDPKGAVAIVSNIVNGFFDLANPSASSIAFDLATKGEAVSSLKITKSVNGGAEKDHATLSSFPATVAVTFNDALAGTGVVPADLQAGDKIVLTFYATTASGTYKSGSLSIDMSCVSDLAGMYSVTATYSQHDFLPDYQTNTMNVEIVEVAAGVYTVNDFSGGLYSAGPYVDAYGTTDFVVEFKDVCNEISWEGQTDPWGPVVATEGGVNSVDPATGVITISWLCEGYGESGVCVYTPL